MSNKQAVKSEEYAHSIRFFFSSSFFAGTVLLDLEKFDLPSIAEAVVENMVITDQLSQTDSNKVLAALLLRHRHQHEFTPPMPRRPSSYNLLAMARKDSKASFPVVDSEHRLPVTDGEGETVEDGTIRLKIDDSVDDVSGPEISQVCLISLIFYIL